jgi:retron-type reverse transcriptase
VSPENFARAYSQTRTGSPKHKAGAIRFSYNETHNLEQLRQELVRGEYRPDEYFKFSVYEPKERVIYAPRYRDKIAQHSVNSVLRDFYEPKFMHDSYACIRGKGNQKAVLRIQQHMRSASINYHDPWIVKADVQKFFYSIDREVMKAIVRRKVTCQKTLDLIERIIDSSPGEKGLPLGNLTSQLLANVMMNEIDQYIKRTLKVKRYVRYADDLVLLVDGKAQAGDMLGCIEAFGRDVIRLIFPGRKCFIRPLRGGLETLGYKISPARLSLTSKKKGAFILRLNTADQLLAAGRMSISEALQSLTSWYSYAGMADCQLFVKDACLKTHRIRFTHNQRFIISRI